MTSCLDRDWLTLWGAYVHEYARSGGVPSHLEVLTKWYILSYIFQQQSCSARSVLSFDIHIGGGPCGVFNFTFSNSGEGGINKLTSDSDSEAQTTPGTIETITKFDY